MPPVEQSAAAPERAGAAQQLQRQQLDAIGSQTFHLWSIYALIVVVLTAGICALVLPNIFWETSYLRADVRYLPQLLLGFIALIVLFNLYAFEQSRRLRKTREELLEQLERGAVAERLALVDPLTETFNRRYMEKILAAESNRADRRNTKLTLVMADVDDFKDANTKFGHLLGDQILHEVAHLLKSTFRGSDSVVRYGGDEFLIVLPDTDETQALAAIRRLKNAVSEWNASEIVPAYKLAITIGTETYSKGKSIADVLHAADTNMMEQKSARSEVR
jgi:diguanylate cyclase (GGDEF)-like protein